MTNNFNNIPPAGVSAAQFSARIGRRDVLPTSIRFRLTEFINNATGNLEVKDNSGNVFLILDRANGEVVFYNNDGVTEGTEFYRPVSFEHTFTGSGSYLDNTGSEFKFNADDFPGFDFAYEACMSVEQSGRTAYSRIYNITDGSAVTGSEITSTAVGITAQLPQAVRSAGLTFPSGEKDYIIQRKQDPAGDGGDNMHMYLATLVFDKQ